MSSARASDSNILLLLLGGLFTYVYVKKVGVPAPRPAGRVDVIYDPGYVNRKPLEELKKDVATGDYVPTTHYGERLSSYSAPALIIDKDSIAVAPTTTVGGRTYVNTIDFASLRSSSSGRYAIM